MSPDGDNKFQHDYQNGQTVGLCLSLIHVLKSFLFQGIRIITDIDTHPFLFSQIASIFSSCSPSLLAEVREWQQVSSLSFALNVLLFSSVFSGGLCLRYGSFSSQLQESSLHVHSLACFDTAIPFISGTMALPPDPLADRICDTMLATILAFPLPSGTQPAQPRPDDLERIMDCRVLYDEPRMRTLIASFDDSSQRSLEAASDRERSRLPLFPGHFSVWDPDCLDKRSNPFDSGEWMYYQLILFLSFVVRCESVPRSCIRPRSQTRFETHACRLLHPYTEQQHKHELSGVTTMCKTPGRFFVT